MEHLLLFLDPVLIAPYRWLPWPVAGYLCGTLLLALACALLGVGTLRLARRMHAARLGRLEDDMRRYHELSEEALRREGKETFKAVNAQAHEAFGFHFSLSGALFVASLWPVPLALAWMQMRFAAAGPELPFALPLLGAQPGFVFWFLLGYIPLRMLLGRLLPAPAPLPRHTSANACADANTPERMRG